MTPVKRLVLREVAGRVIDVSGLVFDDENEAKFARHGVTIDDVQQVFDKWPRFYRNRPDRRASHVMVGPTRSGRLLVVPLEEWGPEGLWRPVTAFEASPQQAARYRSRS
jgi:uncharacterized DUF497 family protein